MHANKQAPIACTLSAADFNNRAQWLKKLATGALIKHEVSGLWARLTYKLNAADDVVKLVRQEQQCCSFLLFDVVRSGENVEPAITTPPESGDDAEALFAHLIPS